MKKIKNFLLFKPLEQLVGIAEYIHTLHGKKEHRILFFTALLLSSGIFIYILGGSAQVPQANISFSDINLPKIRSAQAGQAVYDPLKLLSDIRNQNDVLIIDLRSAEDYEQGHIKSAVSIPVQSEVSRYPDEEAVNKAVDEIKKQSDNRQVVVYAHFQGSTFVPEVVSKLQKKRVSAAGLAVGWNEWAHLRNVWLPESMWDITDMDLYIQRNK